MTVTVDLNGCRAIAKRLARIRSGSFAHDSYESTAFGKSSYQVHLLGALAEVAFSIRYGPLVDMEQRLSGDCHDFEAEYRGKRATFDVKSTTYSPAKLLVRDSKTESDYYVAAYIDGPSATTVDFVGIASRSALLDGDFIESYAQNGDHYNYELWQDELESMPEPSEITVT